MSKAAHSGTRGARRALMYNPNLTCANIDARIKLQMHSDKQKASVKSDFFSPAETKRFFFFLRPLRLTNLEKAAVTNRIREIAAQSGADCWEVSVSILVMRSNVLFKSAQLELFLEEYAVGKWVTLGGDARQARRRNAEGGDSDEDALVIGLWKVRRLSISFLRNRRGKQLREFTKTRWFVVFGLQPQTASTGSKLQHKKRVEVTDPKPCLAWSEIHSSEIPRRPSTKCSAARLR